ncbi:hypothetical protein [Prochlorococcus sp. MIT 1223]|uniref:hypothetical protein n=1 Tax=Prochlorococcus sp. MIT 1223 TaxID=3096217 RepID=UPI002A75E565|nr:hypothetical protein [Prochlorococcus sp. MIT 1223]
MREILPRPITPLEEFERALFKANLSESDLELIEYIRYIGVFNQPSLVKDLRLKPKPPVLSIICECCRKIGGYMPSHFEAVRIWSKSINPFGVRWDGDLLCSSAWNVDGDPLTPEAGTSPYDTLVVHKELFQGLD